MFLVVRERPRHNWDHNSFQTEAGARCTREQAAIAEQSHRVGRRWKASPSSLAEQNGRGFWPEVGTWKGQERAQAGGSHAQDGDPGVEVG